MIGEALTLARNFGPWFAGVALAAFLGGNWTGYKVGKWVYEEAAQRAEKALADYKADDENARTDAALRNVEIVGEVRSKHDEVTQSIGALVSDIDRLRRDVRVCAATSNLRIPEATPGTGASPAGGEPRPADTVLQELSLRFAQAADRCAAQTNALIDWLALTQAGK